MIYFCITLYLFIKEKIEDGSCVVVAVSTGPDSMCLLNLVLEIREEKNIDVVVAHINHNLREESKAESEFARKYAKDNRCKFEIVELGDFETNSIENEAREKRLKKYD